MNDRLCSIKRCNKKVWWRSYCSTHGQRLKFNGDPLLTKYETHGMRNTPEYTTWRHMRERCNNKKDKSYSRYGGRDIKVCDEWNNSFMAFYRDMGSKPTKKHQIDRIDNNGNYEPANCKWATPVEQANNRRSNNRFTYKGQTLTIKQWAEYSGIDYDKLRQRLMRYDWPIDKALKD